MRTDLIFFATYKEVNNYFLDSGMQGFMQDKIIASHTCFGGPMDVNC